MSELSKESNRKLVQLDEMMDYFDLLAPAKAKEYASKYDLLELRDGDDTPIEEAYNSIKPIVTELMLEECSYKPKTEPYWHQLVAFYKHCNDEYYALFADMGTGKSKISIDIAAYKYLKNDIDAVLIIAPNHVHTQWIVEQLPVHCPVDYTALVWSSAKSNTNIFQHTLDDFLTPKINKLKVFAVNVEAFQSESIIPTVATYVKHNNVYTIVDEATRIKTPTAKRSKTIHKLEKYGHRAILTGTPVTKSPFGLWSMFEFLKKGFFGVNYFIFQQRHGVMMNGVNQQTGGRYKTLIDEKTWNIARKKINDTKEMRNGPLMPDDYLAISAAYGLSEKNIKFIEKQQEFVKYKRLEELKEQINPITFYANKADCLDLPEKIYETLYVQMDKEHKKIYTKLKNELLVEYEDKELTVTNKAALTTRLMQVCGGFFPYEVEGEIIKGAEHIQVMKKEAVMIGKKNTKLERIKEDLEELGSQFPIILWAKFIPELKYLYEVLKKDYKCCLYYGGTHQQERATIIDDFKLGVYDIFIGNPATAGFGLNLQNATTQYYYSNDYVVENRLQAEDRSHRLGVKDNCLYKDVVYKGTIDEKITRAITQGRDMNNFFKEQSLRELFEEEK